MSHGPEPRFRDTSVPHASGMVAFGRSFDLFIVPPTFQIIYSNP